MQIFNHEPVIKTYGNGMQITFPNKYTVVIKSGPGAACTQTKTATDPTEMLMASRFGGNYGPDVEVEIYSIAHSQELLLHYARYRIYYSLQKRKQLHKELARIFY